MTTRVVPVSLLLLMPKYHKLKIIKVLLKNGQYRKAIGMAFLMLLSKILPGRRLIYQKKSETLSEELEDSDYQVLCFSSAEECKAKLGERLTDGRSMKFPLEKYSANGRLLWLGLKDNIIVSVACTSRAHSDKYFFELKKNEVAISRCQTHAKYRGMGLYPRSLSKIMCQLTTEGIESFYIDCYEYNWPSIRGIEKAGFKLIGCGWDKKGKLLFKPLQLIKA